MYIIYGLIYKIMLDRCNSSFFSSFIVKWLVIIIIYLNSS